MNRIIGIGLLVVGIILLATGLNVADSPLSELSKVFTGEPTDRALVFMIGGGALTAIGLGALGLPLLSAGRGR